jgi:hypothetical protein
MGNLDHHQPGDPSRLRISDADRQRVAEVLRDAAAEGRIDLDELDERLEQTWAAKTYGDLVPITIDLQHAHPAVAAAQATGVPVVSAHASSSAILGDCKRQGIWSIPERHSALALMGSVTIDLRQAMLTGRETVINVSAIMGEVQVIVPAHMHVIVDGTPIMGEFTQGKDKVAPDLRPDSPVLRVRGMSLMGSVTVKRLPPPGTPKKFLGTW